jgi:excisionase family DNA binding protein
MADTNQSAEDGRSNSRSSCITVLEIARRLRIGRQAVYRLLEQGTIPGIRVGRKWLVTRHAYLQWERTCGLRKTGLIEEPELTLLN